MKKIYLAILALWILSSTLQASELSNAYQKEYAFLKAQKNELQNRLTKEKEQQNADIAQAKEKVMASQQTLLELTKNLDQEKEKLSKLSERLGETQENGDITGNIVEQTRLALEEYGIKVSESNTTSNIEKIQQAFNDTAALYTTLSSLRNEKGKFFLPDGAVVEGDIVKVGNIATYGIAKKAAGALAPAGNGAYKLWNAVESADDAKALYAQEMKSPLDIFVYENLDKEVEYSKEKTMKDSLDTGGPIAYFILALGALGVLLLLYRIKVLLKAGSNVKEISHIVVEKLKSGKSDEALDAIKDYEGSTARVMKATLRNIKSDREHIEDIVTENIINESGNIDQYGNFILVLAAVAPLVGLLGTVTGMITTFNDIAEFGTSDPNLLSGGISEALVNTELGLAVAIPLLLGGNLLSGWAQTIKDTMEQSALHIVNIYKKHNIQ